jgi:flavin reductase (DIM6/NTAB) family NADH-FMN oxidoreductase RutF
MAAKGVRSEKFRELLGRFATGVTVLTAVDGAGKPAGMTASALSAVSLDPPLLLVCINRTTEFCAVLRDSLRFAINVLAEEQEDLSRRFAAEVLDRFAGVSYRIGSEGLPLLDGVVAHILCEVEEAKDSGDHVVFFARVVGGRVYDRSPLLHFRGSYWGLRESR